MKRLFDIVASGLGLVVLSPLFLILALWIKLDSKGPVFTAKYVLVGPIKTSVCTWSMWRSTTSFMTWA